MASSPKKKSTRSTSTRSSKGKKRSTSYKQSKQEYELLLEIKMILIAGFAVILFLCNFGLIGKVGNFVSDIFFGLFGVLAYVLPVFLGGLIIFLLVNNSSRIVAIKTSSSCFLFLLIDMMADFIGGICKTTSKFDFKDFYNYGFENKRGGGLFGGSLMYGLIKLVSNVGAVVIVVILTVVFVILLMQRSFVKTVKETNEKLTARRNEEKQIRREVLEERNQIVEERRAQKEKERAQREEERRLRNEENIVKRKDAYLKKEEERLAKEDNKVLKANKKLSGITNDTLIAPVIPNDQPKRNDEIHEIKLNGFDELTASFSEDAVKVETMPQVNNGNGSMTGTFAEAKEIIEAEPNLGLDSIPKVGSFGDKDLFVETAPASNKESEKKADNIVNEIDQNTQKPSGTYKFPPLSLLTKGNKNAKGDSTEDIRRTAAKLQETLAIFGVEATVTDISQGPTVTRYELQPKLGVKVSRIKSLSDDIKLNLAAADIRIEAPIPGKAAIGIEVPNKENQAVLLHDLIEVKEFKDAKSNLTFAVGKDIGGNTILYDIDKFPHLLIAGATGSGKSVCINTLIVSIIYKANPNDVKLIMIDPKVVELSVYNGIPHLLLPVVTDAKKASATLNYAVNEMMERYKKFADLGTRDLAGYNEVIEKKAKETGDFELYKKLPQIVVIVDELADLIMVAKNEVEDAICRLAQLARAAGIHLIIATQRPSVDVITGLIKANMPSRLAFAVSSQVDSRTILDMSGAEELLGKGDMLFFPKGLKKPVRLQGGFVSDEDVLKVVDFLKQQGISGYDEAITEKINSMSDSGSGSATSGESSSGFDDMFIEAGRFIIQNNNASIGNLQRKFKMGFNRAARIVDQLCEAGVVGAAEGTKAREIYMSLEQFENFVENNM